MIFWGQALLFDISMTQREDRCLECANVKKQSPTAYIMKRMRVESEFVGKTFDDFLFRPQCGIVRSRKQVDLTSRFSRHITISLPVVSANMDSVTGAAMAKTLALEGGVGIIHRGMTIAEQAREVSLVKRSYGYIV